ncbi:hypothetical protein OOU_Y34scaffold00132g4 [Pyricularia oryzae Y34]|uniref:Uncharacterized protein n=2 Tax=Pyricularia oryzae TaxID=318829 RepID=A0AA97P825_PYRO3|nr:hypothetical protein OOU_Y34scaffold00132g4 [Pyricularia oryzae Y34]
MSMLQAGALPRSTVAANLVSEQ